MTTSWYTENRANLDHILFLAETGAWRQAHIEICAAFTWGLSPQGHDFWRRVSIAFRKKADERGR